MNSIEQMLDSLIAREGEYSNDSRDLGQETMFGITARVARANGYTGQMRTLTREQAKAIYRQQYWIGPGFASVATLSPAIAEELFDTGVNMGPGVAAEFLQRALNALNDQGRLYPDIAVDRDIGPATLRSLKAFLDRRGAEGAAVMLKALNCLQGERYVALAEKRQANEAFLFGWLRTRVA